MAFCDTHVKSKLSMAQAAGRKDPYKCKKCGCGQSLLHHRCCGQHIKLERGINTLIFCSKDASVQLRYSLRGVGFVLLQTSSIGHGAFLDCRFELQESKMLSMSTRRHEYGRQTRDDAAEVCLTLLPAI